jgi:type IV pilus assembly protein PilA
MEILLWALVKRSLETKRERLPPSTTTIRAGFTLIEVLVVIVIVGILSAIALPAFLNQASRASQASAQSYIGAINRAQQAYRMDSPNFANSVEILDAGIPVETDRYSYAIAVAESQHTIVEAVPKDDLLAGYVGIVYINIDAAHNATMTTELCEGDIGEVPNVTLTATPTGYLLSGC